MTTLVLSPIFALTLASAAQSVAGARAAAVSRAEARFMPPAEPDLHGPHTAAPMPAPTPTAQAAPHNGTPARPRQARLPLSPTAPSCTGPTLTSQSQVQPSTSYCGGHATSRIVLASNDTWTGGEVSGVSSGFQQGAVQCGNPCTLINMNIHDNPNAFAGIYAPAGGYLSGPMTISGGRVSGSGSLGIGGSAVNNLTISGVEIDHNGASASCGGEGGGFKGINQGSRFTNNYVHDNNCMGVWYDISSDNNVIANNRVDNNADGGIFYEISFNASIHDNEVSGNGHGACTWLWGAGIGVASSGGFQVYNNTLSNNCNGVGETQQNRGTSSITSGSIPVGTPFLLQNVDVHNNTVSGASSRTGAVADNGANLTARNLNWSYNTLSNGASFCGLSC
jgi:parallel beta-helix repeat protein